MEEVADLALEVWTEEYTPFRLNLEVERQGTRNSIIRNWFLNVDRRIVDQLQYQFPEEEDWDRAVHLVEVKKKWRILNVQILP